MLEERIINNEGKRERSSKSKGNTFKNSVIDIKA